MTTKTISVCNQKGGVAKTTTAINLLAGLKRRGYKVLGIDLDSQCNLTSTFNGSTRGATSLSLLLKEATAEEAIQETAEGIDLIAGSMGLASSPIKERGLLKDALHSISGMYDFIVIDTAPVLNIILLNALAVSNGVVIPVSSDSYCLDGVAFLNQTINEIRKNDNKNLSVYGLLLTMFDNRTKLSRGVKYLTGQCAVSMGTKLFQSTIRNSVVAKEAIISNKSLFSYELNAPATRDYNAFITELLTEIRK